MIYLMNSAVMPAGNYGTYRYSPATLEDLAADPYLEDCITHLEWRGIAKAVREGACVTVIFEEQQ